MLLASALKTERQKFFLYTLYFENLFQFKGVINAKVHAIRTHGPPEFYQCNFCGKVKSSTPYSDIMLIQQMGDMIHLFKVVGRKGWKFGTWTFFRRTLFRPISKVDIFSTSNKMGHIFDHPRFIRNSYFNLNINWKRNCSMAWLGF